MGIRVVIYSLPFEVERFISVYRLAEDGSLLKEGGVRLSIWALRAALIRPKRKTDSRAQPHPLQGVFPVFILSAGHRVVFMSSSRAKKSRRASLRADPSINRTHGQ